MWNCSFAATYTGDAAPTALSHPTPPEENGAYERQTDWIDFATYMPASKRINYGILSYEEIEYLDFMYLPLTHVFKADLWWETVSAVAYMDCITSSWCFLCFSGPNKMDGFREHIVPQIHTSEWCVELWWVPVCVCVCVCVWVSV